MSENRTDPSTAIAPPSVNSPWSQSFSSFAPGNEALDRQRPFLALGPKLGREGQDLGFAGLVALRPLRLGCGKERGQHLPRGAVAGADFGIEIVGGFGPEQLQHWTHRAFGEVLAILAERLLQHRLAERDVFDPLLVADVAADAGPRLAGDDEALPRR